MLYFLLVLLLSIALLAFIFWKVFIGYPWGELGLELFAGMLGMGITVLIVDKLLKRQREHELLPIRIAYYRDTHLFLTKLISFWASAYNYSVPKDNPKTVEELFSEESFADIAENLDLNAIVPGVPFDKTWFDFFDEKAEEFEKTGKEILSQYSVYLDPDIFGSMHHVAKCGLFVISMKDIKKFREYNEKKKLPQSATLNNYYYMWEDEDFEHLIHIYKWCMECYDEISKLRRGITVKAVGFPIRKNKKMPPPCMISSDEQT
ncbi:MAG: hypothetical protein FWC20_05740 [Oscillospiraceae bacterium]|nr:hypothetical protein [Oscillospiraceae bacterium]MCL2278895.1 hypothetical protein [Oscillospiraceae bacterium]